MGRSINTQYKFGPYTLEPDERRILGDGNATIELTAKAFDLLVLLVSKAEQLVTKDEILDAVWPEVSIAESNLTTTISMIRKTLQEDAEHRYIETIPKKGYRFVAPVSVVVEPARDGTEPVNQTLASPISDEKMRFRLRLSGLLIVLVATGIAFGVLHHRHLAANIPKTSYQLGIRLEVEGKDNDAIKKLNEVPPSDPEFARARLKAAWLSYQADRDDEANLYLAAVKDGKAVPDTEPRDKATLREIKGLKELLADQTNDALYDFQSAADTDPTNIDALIYVADTAISNGNLQEADKALEKCQALDGLDPFCGFEQIYALTYEGQFDPAIAKYNQLRKVSNNPWLDEPAGYAELAKGNIPEALKHFNSLAAQGRDGNVVHFMAAQDGIAAANLLDGKLTAARNDLTTAIGQTNSKYEQADYLILLAKIDALDVNPSRAKEELEEATKLSDAPELAIQIARTFAVLGDHATAQRFLGRQQSSSPGLGLKYGATKPFIDGMESLKGHDFNAATEQLALSFRMDQSPETAYFLAKAEMGKGDWDAAIISLNSILRNKARVFTDSIASLIPLAEYDLSLCYQGLGQESEAHDHLSSAFRIWAHADPELKAHFTNSMNNMGTGKIPKSQ
jgi:DNA-binding winged helix-turn-helix (wHTH) protein/tetratricopeptide (TPR) repeat protein